MSDSEHKELAELLNNVKGKVALSNYESELMDSLYPEPKWYKHMAPERTIHSSKGKRVEVLWTNYKPSENITNFNLNLSL